MDTSSRAIVWTLAILAVVLVAIPLMGMIGMMGMGGMMMGGNMNGMMGMHTVGILWMALGVAIVIALVVVLLRGTTKT